MKNKDRFDSIEEAQEEYWKKLEERKMHITFEHWLFKEEEEEPKEEQKEKNCKNCRFFLNLDILPMMNMPSRCLLGFGEVSPVQTDGDGECTHWAEEGKADPSCLNCKYGAMSLDGTVCFHYWEVMDDEDKCEHWEERHKG